MSRSSAPPAPLATPAPFDQRGAGLLLHPTSLPKGHGTGDLGPAAYEFVDFLAAAGQRYWQMLPICPPGHGYSPYDSPSSFAISPTLLSLELLAETGLCCLDELGVEGPWAAQRKADFSQADTVKSRAIALSHSRLQARATPDFKADYETFKQTAGDWLDNHALFLALKEAHEGKCWTEFSPDLRDRRPEALEKARRDLAETIDRHTFAQFELKRQWDRLKARLKAANVLLIGDIPIYVSHDSADVWANRESFWLAKDGTREVVAGVPPDYFSETGQLWGNPLYRWPAMQRDHFRWWLSRLQTCLTRFDAVRLDHFIGFRRYWEVPATAPTAQQGRYVDVPGEKFFAKALQTLGRLPLIAEDLGVVTPEVTALRKRFCLPGMKILQFAFDDPNGSDYLPHRFEVNTTVYTGTHDNDTTAGWFHSSPPEEPIARQHHEAVRERVRRYLGYDADPIHWKLIQIALGSVANTAIVPVQDLLGLGSDARMNTPGTTADNWSFRLLDGELGQEQAGRLRSLCLAYER